MGWTRTVGLLSWDHPAVQLWCVVPLREVTRPEWCHEASGWTHFAFIFKINDLVRWLRNQECVLKIVNRTCMMLVTDAHIREIKCFFIFYSYFLCPWGSVLHDLRCCLMELKAGQCSPAMMSFACDWPLPRVITGGSPRGLLNVRQRERIMWFI